MTREVLAYAFRSTLTIAELLATLNRLGPWKWVERDNDRWADYISTLGTGDPHCWSAKIIIEPEMQRRFVLNLRFRSDDAMGQQVFDSVRQTLLELLPMIGAVELEEVDDYE
jgi:hypothetical protein